MDEASALLRLITVIDVCREMKRAGALSTRQICVNGIFGDAILAADLLGLQVARFDGCLHVSSSDSEIGRGFVERHGA